MQINRLFEIVYILLDKKSITANELAEHFGGIQRTILRDIETLTIGEFYLHHKGEGRGNSIMDNFVLNKTAVSEEEQNQILIALQSLAPHSIWIRTASYPGWCAVSENGYLMD